jgi:hypothetical protein
VFAGWTGACTGPDYTCTFTADDPTSVTATFGDLELVDVRKTGDGQGTVVQIWHGKRLISQAKLSLHQGAVTVQLPFSAGYAGGQYDLWAYVTGQGEAKPKLLHWKVQVP